MTFLKTSLKTSQFIALATLCAAAAPAFAHVSLAEKSASAGSAFKAAFQVGHGCQGSPTTGITVQIPAGFQGAKPVAKAGWTLKTDAAQVSWTATGKDAALKDTQAGEFVVEGRLPAATGPMWFKVLQTCETGSTDWSEVPATGTVTKGMKTPAALLDVTAAQAVQVKNGWVRATVAGQQGTGAFMTFTATKATRLVGVTSPVAGVASVHEMKMEGDVMKMRAMDGLDLPAGQPVEMKSGGFHLMLQDLKQPVKAGTTVPLTLTFKDAAGVESRMDVQLPAALTAPGKAAKAGAMDHSAHQH